jgi:predicted acylesterase/phospholipase RssA
MDRRRVSTLQARSLAVLLAAALLAAGCFLRTPYLLEAANKPPKPGIQPPGRDMVDRIGRIVRTHLVDGYVDPERVGRWLDAMSQNPEPLLNVVAWLGGEPRGDPDSVYGRFNLEVSPPLILSRGDDLAAKEASAWEISPPLLSIKDGIVGLGALAEPLEEKNEQIVGLELDAERFVANARGIPSSLLVLQDLAGSEPLPEAVLREGIRRGAALTKAYLQARCWHRRVGHPATAIVMSGGAANGAFTAGFVWRLTDVLQTCRLASGDQGCPDAGIDLAIGTSTGSLIGVMLDIFSTPGQEQQGRDLLLSNYTCVTAADVYCVNDVWVWRLLQNTRGLVQFDGLRNKLRQMLTEAERENAMELVTMTVDYQTGDLLAESDQDPVDGQSKDDRINAVLASSVEPVMADPIERPPRPGTFIDGGVRSGTPAMEAVRRGAERVLVIKSASLDSDVQPRQPHALKMLARTIELFVDQVGASEIQQATLFATARRLGEYNLCEYRLQLAGKTNSKNPDQRTVEEARKERERFCRRESLARSMARRIAEDRAARNALLGPVPAWTGPDYFGLVAHSFRSAWVARPEGAESASGYGVDPALMRRLFARGIATFQMRCQEVLQLLDIPMAVRETQCADNAGNAAYERARAEMDQCSPKAGGVKPCKR